MSRMNLTGRRGAGAAFAAAAALALVLTGCGRPDNHPYIVGEVSPEALAAVPVVAAVPRPATSAAVALSPGHHSTAGSASLAGALAAGALVAGRPAVLPATPRAGTAKAAKGARRPPAGASTVTRSAAPKTAAIAPTTRRAAAKAATADAALAMPAAGSQVYDMSGTSSLGPPPRTMSLTVADVPGVAGAQRWTFEARTPDGNGVTEDLALGRGPDGVYMSGYRLELSRGIGVTFDFAPATAVLLFPDRPRTGRSWEFEMVSNDGCAKVHTEGILVAAAGGDARERHIRLSSALVGTHKPACVEVDAHRILDVWQSAGSALPTRLDTDFTGSVSGVPFTARTTAILRPDTAATRP
jgi:hypothetical protein